MRESAGSLNTHLNSGCDTDNIGLMGASAGGGLALATALMLRDRLGPSLKYLLPIYPMIDDRHETASSHEVVDIGIWDRAGSIEAWGWYLGRHEPDAYAAPARAEDLSRITAHLHRRRRSGLVPR